jgi:hypothetical protein
MARLALHDELSVVNKTIRKTVTRWAAEHSIRAAFNLVLLVAVHHFIEVAKEDAGVARDMKVLPESTRKLYDLVTLARDGPVLPIKAAMITSTDDTCEYVHEGSVDKPDVFRLVSKQSVKARGTRALYDLNKGKDQMNGIQCKISMTMNAIGAHSPIIVSDYEMPIDEDVLAVEVPGLCVGGGVGSNTQVGHLSFVERCIIKKSKNNILKDDGMD